MAAGSLTRYFGMSLVNLLADKIQVGMPNFKTEIFVNSLSKITDLSLMNRIHLIADALAEVLPLEAQLVWDIQKSILGPPLRLDQQTFNDGYWMLPLADYWARHQLASFETAVIAIENLTQRGTSEFAVRHFFQEYPEKMKDVLSGWTMHSSYHVRRLATEGSRPYLPWGGRLKVTESVMEDYLHIISIIKSDNSSYVRRSVGNHVRDWRRISPDIADKWIIENDPPGDVLRFALPKR